MLKHYVDYTYVGGRFFEHDIREITQEQRLHPESLDVPKYAFQFQFYDVEVAIVGGEELRGQPKNYSHRYFFGKIMTYEEVLAMPKSEQGFLADNMKINGWNNVVRTSAGVYVPFNEGDIILAET